MIGIHETARMEPISLIVTALVAGASAALKDTASTTVKDAYAGLKALVMRRFSGNTKAESQLAAVERAPAAGAADLKQHLQAAGADRDKDLLRKARELLQHVDPEGSRAGKYNLTVSGGKGVVVGDNASVSMNFND
jgi:hypothetical protein